MPSAKELIIREKPDVTQEITDISKAKEEIEKYQELIKEKQERIRLKKEQELRDSQEQKLIISRKELEQIIDKINYFKHTSPFNENLSFMKGLIDFYNRLDDYQKSEVYQTTDFLQFNAEREKIYKIIKSGKRALSVLGDQAYRTLLKSFTDRFLKLEKKIDALSKKVSKNAR